MAALAQRLRLRLILLATLRPSSAGRRQMSRSFIAGISAVAGALTLTGLAAAMPVLDQQQTIVDPGSGPLIGGSGPQVMAQVVRSGKAGLVAQVELSLSCNDSASVVLQVRDASTFGRRPGETVLASQTVTDIPLTVAWRSITLSNPPFIPDATEFTIVLSSSGFCSTRGGPLQANLYAPGDAWYQGPPSPPGIWSFAGIDLAFMTFVEPMCKVPTLVGSAQTEVQGRLISHGCSVGRITRAYSRTVASGDVISQSQPEGTRLAAGTAVDVVVSRGRRMCVVPNVRRKTLAEARPMLAQGGCRMGAVRRARSTKALKGRVIRQRPQPGTRMREGGRVSLVVGRGTA